MAVKLEEYDGDDEKTIVAATTDIAPCASPRHSRRRTYKLKREGVAWACGLWCSLRCSGGFSKSLPGLTPPSDRSDARPSDKRAPCISGAHLTSRGLE